MMYFHPWKYFANSWWWNLAKKFYPPAVNQITNCARVKAILILVKAENYEISINCMHEWKFACICHINFSISLENIAIIDLNFVKKSIKYWWSQVKKGLKYFLVLLDLFWGNSEIYVANACKFSFMNACNVWKFHSCLLSARK